MWFSEICIPFSREKSSVAVPGAVSVLPPKVTARVAIEQASAFGWERYVGQSGRVIGMQTFGASAPLKALMTEYGFTVDNVVTAAKAQLALVPHS